MVVFLLDLSVLVIPFAIIVCLFRLYYIIFVNGYVKKIKQAQENGEFDKASKMKAIAVKRQPKRMIVLFKRYGIQ